jgi:hypothetical protein
MDKAPAYGAGDSGFESQYGLSPFYLPLVNKLFFLDAPRLPRAETTKNTKGVMRESNSRPPAPEAGIIPLDQSPTRHR